MEQEQKEHCHICKDEAYWKCHIFFQENIHVEIYTCDRHRPVVAEIQHTENIGLIHHEFNKDEMMKIHWGEKREPVQFIGPELGKPCFRREQ